MFKKGLIILGLIFLGMLIGRQLTLKTLEIVDFQEDTIYIESFGHTNIYEIF